jgi:dephospho-CoA kinase
MLFLEMFLGFKNCFVITGSIATGKSSVCSILGSKGFEIIDADKIAHEKLLKNSHTIELMFGAKFVDNGCVDRKRLGALIFSDTNAKKKLENLLHPKIKSAIMNMAQSLEKLGKPFFVDIPLFFETNNYEFDQVVLIYAPRDIQLARLMKRENMTEVEANNRINMQIDIEEKRLKSKFIIDNSGDLDNLMLEVDSFIKQITEINK